MYETEADGGQEADTEWSPYSPPEEQQYVNHGVMFQYDPSVTSMAASEAQMDQFDALFSKSLQLQQQQQTDYEGCPEVNIEVPSDSDSSRRPSKYTLSSNSSIQNINEQQQAERIRRQSFQVQNVQRRTSRGQSPAGSTLSNYPPAHFYTMYEKERDFFDGSKKKVSKNNTFHGAF